MSEHRVKTFLFHALYNWAKSLEQSGIPPMSKDFKITLHDQGSNYCVLQIRDPSEETPRYYELRVVERKSVTD